MSNPPYLIEPAQLAAHLADDAARDAWLIVDLSSPESYAQGHIPGAVHLDYAALNCGQPPAPGLLPPLPQLQEKLQSLGLGAQHVVAYDDQANSRACRLLWTLESLGQHRHSLLNGGAIAWQNEGHAMQTAANRVARGDFVVDWNPSVLAERDQVLAALDDDSIILLDARSAAEYHGQKSAALRAGHIPGARHLDWLDTIDRARHLRFKPADELTAMLDARGITRDSAVITYCQTHHRSSHAFVMLRSLGFANLRGYAGSWSQWGNEPSLPIE